MSLFTDIIPIERAQKESKRVTFETLQVGDSGARALKIDRGGIWMGGQKFADATFSVDMDGNGKFKGTLVAGSIIQDPSFSFSGGGNSMTDMGSGGTVVVGGVTFNTRNVKIAGVTYKFLIQ